MRYGVLVFYFHRERHLSIQSFYQFAYISHLNRDLGPGCITDIIRVARSRNRSLHLTGILIFDGDRFFQYLEGVKQHVMEIVESIRVDPRHREMQTIVDGEKQAPRFFPTWSMAYALTTDENLLMHISLQREAGLGEALLRCIPELDMEP